MLQPRNEYIIAKPLEESKESKSGLITSTESEAILKGEVLAVGSQVEGLSVGDVIVFNPYAPESIKLEGEEYLIIKQEDVMAIVK